MAINTFEKLKAEITALKVKGKKDQAHALLNIFVHALSNPFYPFEIK